jgi:hypothetical protein
MNVPVVTMSLERNIHVVTNSGRKECAFCYCALEEGMYLLLCVGGRNVHVVTVYGRKECTCWYCSGFFVTVTNFVQRSRLVNSIGVQLVKEVPIFYET